MDIKVGFGYDVHQLKEGNKLVLGGIIIPHKKGPVGHSDGDVLIHAICDALLGAANLRDIGYHFPDTSDEFKGIDSKVLLKKTVNLLKEQGYEVGNIDCTVCLQKPKIMQYIPEMQRILSHVIDTEPENISLKATTTEKLGFIGNEKGIAAYAVALIGKKKKSPGKK
ncbi:MAG: 2-C-methyl-D-erythritol 2,4-cyclodiphosphate synthase [Bacteroidales bacterium]